MAATWRDAALLWTELCRSSCLPASRHKATELASARQALESRFKWLTFVVMDAMAPLASRLPEVKLQLASILRKGFQSTSKAGPGLGLA